MSFEHSPSKGSNTLLRGRFSGSTHSVFEEFNRSLPIDKKLVFADILGSLAHLSGLQAAGLVTQIEHDQLARALDQLGERVRKNPELLDLSEAEDIHSFIEAHLINELGDLGKRIHTGRSRNDQVATATRIWLVGEIDLLKKKLESCLFSLLDLADKHFDQVFPSYTHLQRAQPIVFGHWAHSFFEMFKRDLERFKDCKKRTASLPLGSGASSGNGFGLDRNIALKKLNWERLSLNSLDGVSDRDFVCEFHFVASLTAVHLSRLAEDLILYSSQEFGFIQFTDAVSSGSSLLPQKKNPDAAELLRGKSARFIANLQQSLILLKGLPSTYNKDLQEDKESLFESVNLLGKCLEMTEVMFQEMSLNSERCRAAASDPFMMAVDVADALVRTGVPFRTAHECVGQMVRLATEQNKDLSNLSESQLKSIHQTLSLSFVKENLNITHALGRRNSVGGTAPSQVKQALAEARLFLKQTKES
jgi:argininosuccinate lyase